MQAAFFNFTVNQCVINCGFFGPVFVKLPNGGAAEYNKALYSLNKNF